MAQLQFSAKRIQVDKANVTIVIVMSVAAFVTIFSLVACKTLVQQQSYQSRVIEKKETAREQLKQNVDARNKLVAQYKIFAESPVNIIKGSSTGTGERDGDNAKIVLDALPSKYDYPAVATSFEKLIIMNQLSLKNIIGTDNEVEQSAQVGDSSKAIEMPFELTGEGTVENVQAFLGALERSIRPIDVRKLTIVAVNDKISATVNGITYYQPEKTLSIKEEVAR